MCYNNFLRVYSGGSLHLENANFRKKIIPVPPLDRGQYRAALKVHRGSIDDDDDVYLSCAASLLYSIHQYYTLLFPSVNWVKYRDHLDSAATTVILLPQNSTWSSCIYIFSLALVLDSSKQTERSNTFIIRYFVTQDIQGDRSLYTSVHKSNVWH